MTADPFLDEDFRVLTSEAFDFVLNNELKRAVRSQNFLTLVLSNRRRGAQNGGHGDRDQAVREIARLISREVRETDILAHTANGRLSIVLLDADMPELDGGHRTPDVASRPLRIHTPLAIEVAPPVARRTAPTWIRSVAPPKRGRFTPAATPAATLRTPNEGECMRITTTAPFSIAILLSMATVAGAQTSAGAASSSSRPAQPPAEPPLR